MTTWLRVKNWREHQHYGKRRPPWIKLHRAMLEDYAVASLPDASKAHLVGIWLLAVVEEGRVPNDAVWIGRKINATGPIDLQAFVALGLLIPEDGEVVALAHDASVPVQSTLEQGRDRDRDREEAEADSRDDVREKLPEEYREDFDAMARSCHRPESFRLEVATLLAGRHPRAERATPEDVGRGIRELALDGRPHTSLAGFVATAMKRRVEKARDERAKVETVANERRKREQRTVTVSGGGNLTPLSETLSKLGIVPDKGAA